MFTAVNLQVPSPVIKSNCNLSFAARRLSTLRLPNRALASLSFQSVNAPSETSTSSHFTSTVGSPPPSSLQLNFNQRHITVLNLIACVTAISATWLFCSAIPTLLAFKKAAESVEKLMDVAREELPDTMAAVRLSGMELSDLTMELSDLGQGITQGVRSSTRAVRVAQERLSQMTNMAPSGSVQEVATLEIKTQVPMVAKTARGTREAIVKSRSFFQNFCTLVRFSRMAFNYFSSRSKQ
ncbi:uncharacterized protein LOC131304179 isoform X2 [Rhododendron vialii]|uniref:uncharacterized protein LOC131304179 isoform X2 n=1 Tax=Rhododendron vialii TaxID=182163 RepID=UPI00265E38B0|nr:uncharacterized protein LOC131304179 isoform X2 [Rhododendron vialii]